MTKKSITKSLKMTPENEREINEKAKANNMNFSKYLLDCALHNNNSVTPEILCKIENIIEQCRKSVMSDRKTIDKINEEANELWELLK